MCSMLTQMLDVVSYDGYHIDARLCLPKENVRTIVIGVNGSGPQTYTTKRKLPDGTSFQYYDIWAKGFTDRGMGFCSYSQRGVIDADEPPYFVQIDEEKYKQYLPHNSVADVESIIASINQKYPYTKILLLGFSEGTILATQVALRKKAAINALLLIGYCGENLRDTLEWQLSGHTILLQWQRFFDYDKKGYIDRSDIEQDRYKVYKDIFGTKRFEELDLDGDGRITVSDTKPLCLEHRNNLLKAIETGDDDWLKNNHGVRLTSGWFKEHFSMVATKNVITQLDIPIHIFSGEYDSMTPIEQAQETKAEFDRLGKNNMVLHTFLNHDHDLNFLKYLLTGEYSDGMKAVLDTANCL